MSLFHYIAVSLQWKTKTLFCGKLKYQYLQQMVNKQCIMKNLSLYYIYFLYANMYNDFSTISIHKHN
jgi:hypothetical protein